MKLHTTKKSVRNNYDTIICVPYCVLDTLLSQKSPCAYTTRQEGWGADIYDMGGGIAIVTGYAPFGNIYPSYETCYKYESMAKKVRSNYDILYVQMIEELDALISEFINEVTTK